MCGHREKGGISWCLSNGWNLHRHQISEQVAETLMWLEHAGGLVRRRANIRRILPSPVIVTGQGIIYEDTVIDVSLWRKGRDHLAPD